MTVTIDGPNKILIIESGLINVEVKDIYSDWKRWVSENDNSKYEPAFDVLGGDPLSPGINAGTYYFIRNDLGWRLRPYEENNTVYFAGNLTPRDSNYPILLPTTGNHQVLIVGLQPITQSVQEILTLQQDTSYGGKVYIDYTDGQSGTTFPVGTASTPVLNFELGEQIAENLDIDNFVLHGEIILPHEENDFNLESSSSYAILDFNNYRADGWKINGVSLRGRMEYKDWASKSSYYNCRLSNAGNLAADMNQCIINQKISFHTGIFNMNYCSAGEDGAIINLHNRNTKLIIRNWAGSLTLISGSHPSGVVLIDSLSSRIILDETCSDGTYSLYGIGELTDNTTGNNVNLTNLLISASIQQEDSYNGTIHINTLENSSSGTKYPIGTASRPVNNFLDAHTLAENLGIINYKIVGEIELETGLIHSSINSDGHYCKINFNNNYFDGSYIESATVTGIINTEYFDEINSLNKCNVINVSGLNANLKECSIGESVVFNSGEYSLAFCVAGPDGATISMPHRGTSLIFRNWTGPITFLNCCSSDSNIIMDSNSALITIDESCISGNFVFYGIGEVINNSTGNVYIDSNLLKSSRQKDINRKIDDLTAISL